MTAFTPRQRLSLGRLMDDLLPGDEPTPGAGEAGGVDYVEMLLSAFDHDPPRIWAGGPFSGRHGGDEGFAAFLELTPWEAEAWRVRIEGDGGAGAARGLDSVKGWRPTYLEGLAALGEDYPELDDATRADRRTATDPDFLELAFTHACESLYGDPVYGGNRGRTAWAAIDYRGDVQPAGYTDAEVSAP